MRRPGDPAGLRKDGRGGPGPQPPRHIEPTQVLHRDGREQAAPLAWSEVPDADRPPARDGRTLRETVASPDPAYAPAERPHRATHAPTQRPVPFRDDEPPRRRRDVPPPPPSRPPRGAGRAPRPPRPKRKRHLFRWFLVLLVVFALLIVTAIIQLDRTLHRIDALADYAERVGDTPGTNWLLVGSDSRSGLTADQEQGLATGGEVGPERTDTIILVHVPPSGRTTLVSLPRDSYVSIPGYGQDKLNAAFAFGGPQLLVQSVEIATGLHIDHYAQIGFAGFAGVVDALGGIDVCVPQPIDDPLAGINLAAGCQTLDGPQALGFVRTRATALADIDRMNNQRLFLSALLEKATSASTLANPFRLWPMARDTARSLTVDNGDHIWDLARLGWALRGDTLATTVPIGGFTDTSSGNVLLWDKANASRFFEALAAGQPIPEDLRGE
ncbi:LCP family protein [Nocardia cyriacigeorgica]|uniref:LCP family protein n=1 Tax=Nocardia cyriacigeorgica TaxID=135487 RepID=UPI000A307FE5|nr:LCP family protein [Nocardia cyriacigeorgica]MBF6084536.1 LCP family protein [Nocardia cyriacigeorgica]MBF6286655.1 LCP family protein [Nocardia cyriacigeorgica]